MELGAAEPEGPSTFWAQQAGESPRGNATIRSLLDPKLVTTCPAGGEEPCPRIPLHSRARLDGGRAQELSRFHQLSQQHRKFYQDKTGTLYPLPYFVMPVTEQEKYPPPLDFPPLSSRTRWLLLRVAPGNLRGFQTFPSGKRVPFQERNIRDTFFEFRG